MAAASSLALWNGMAGKGDSSQLETIEMDPQYAQSLELPEGCVVSFGQLSLEP